MHEEIKTAKKVAWGTKMASELRSDEQGTKRYPACASMHQAEPDATGYFDSLASLTRAASSFRLTFATSSGSLSIPAGERKSFSDACHCVIASLILPSLKYTSPRWSWTVGDVYFKLGKIKEAITQWQASLKDFRA